MAAFAFSLFIVMMVWGYFEALSLGIPTSAERSKQISWGASQTGHLAHLSRFYPPLTRVQFQPGKKTL